MKKQSVLQSMSRGHRYLIYHFFIAYFAMGVYLTLIGSELPLIKAEYQISYRVGGMMMSAQAIGYLIVGAFAGILPRYLGAKKTSLILNNVAFIGLVFMMMTGNPAILLFSMLLTGVSKGSTCNFGNQIVSTLSGNNAGLLNLTQAFFAIGACIAPLIAMACGASWRASLIISVVIGIANLLYGSRMEIGPEAYAQENKKLEFGFFKTKLFWICALILVCYLAIESSIMGWLVTFFIDSGTASDATAQLITTALWGALLVGRFVCAWLASRFKPYQMIAVMTPGIAVSFTALMISHTLIPMAISAIGLGLFMSGIYGTAIAGSGDLAERYPMCMGMFVAIPGIGSAVAPSAIGTIADHIGIRGGMCFLYVLIVILIIMTILQVVYHKKRKMAE